MFDLNINIKNIILIGILFLFVSLILFIFSSYIVLKLLKRSLDDNNILFYQLNKKYMPLHLNFFRLLYPFLDVTIQTCSIRAPFCRPAALRSLLDTQSGSSYAANITA